MQTSNSSARDHVPFSSLELSYSRKPFDLGHNNESKRSSRHAIIEQELTFLTYDLNCFVLYEARNAGHMELFPTNWGYNYGTNNLLTLSSSAESLEKTATIFKATCYSKFICKCSTRVTVTFFSSVKQLLCFFI